MIDYAIAPDGGRTEAGCPVYSGDAGRGEASERLADTSAGAGGLPDKAGLSLRSDGAAIDVSAGGGVSGESGADMREVFAAVDFRAACRELAHRAAAYCRANEDAYIAWHVKKYGCRPAGF